MGDGILQLLDRVQAGCCGKFENERDRGRDTADQPFCNRQVDYDSIGWIAET